MSCLWLLPAVTSRLEAVLLPGAAPQPEQLCGKCCLWPVFSLHVHCWVLFCFLIREFDRQGLCSRLYSSGRTFPAAPSFCQDMKHKLLQLPWALRLLEYFLMKGLMLLLKACPFCCTLAHQIWTWEIVFHLSVRVMGNFWFCFASDAIAAWISAYRARESHPNRVLWNGTLAFSV